MTAATDPLSIYVAAAGIVLLVVAERLFMRSHTGDDQTMDM